MDTKSELHFLSLIIPVYKQEKTIVQDLKHIVKELESLRYPYEVIAVVDGIHDKSLQKIKKQNIPQVRSISYMKNQGKSYAIRLGMKKAKGDYVMFIDSGREIHPNGISMLIEHMDWYNADIIVGSKRHPASIVTYSKIRKILSYGYSFIVKLLFDIKVSDTQAGIKIFRKKVLQNILPLLVEKKFAGDLEMLVAAKSLGYKKIFEAPIRLDYTLSKLTSAATFRSIYGILVDTCAIYYRKNFLNHYKRKATVLQ